MQKRTQPTFLPWHISVAKKGMTTVNLSSAVVNNLDWLDRFFRAPKKCVASASKKKMPTWNPAVFDEGRRNDKNVRAITALVLDYDHPEWSPAKLHKHIKEEVKLAHGIHTTLGHTPENPRYRLVLFLDRAIPIEELKGPRGNRRAATQCLKRLHENAAIRVGYVDGLDKSTSDLSRTWVCPVQHPEVEYEGYLEVADSPLCVDEIMEEPPKPQQLNLSAWPGEDGKRKVPLNLAITLSPRDGGGVRSVADLWEEGIAQQQACLERGVEPDERIGRFRCACPIEPGASPGSAYIDVAKNLRLRLRCESQNHAHAKGEHPQRTFWASREADDQKKKASTFEESNKILAEVPNAVRLHVEKSISYSTRLKAWVEYQDNAWQVGAPMKERDIHHYMEGRLRERNDTTPLGHKHVLALIGDTHSRQSRGYVCESRGAPVVSTDEGLMLNLYAKPRLVPREGEGVTEQSRWPNIYEIVQVLTGHESAALDWLLDWTANLIQHPEQRGMIAVISTSPQQGIGKSLYGNILREVIGRENCATVTDRGLRDTFNPFALKLLCMADELEIGGRGNASVTASMKTYITDETVSCRLPNCAPTTETNRMTWWMTSNKTKPINVEKNDRRYTILRASQVSRFYRDKFSSFFKTGEDGGTFTDAFQEEIAAFAYDMRRRSVNVQILSRPIETQAKKDLIELSKSTTERFIDDLNYLGLPALSQKCPPNPQFVVNRSTEVSKGTTSVHTMYLYGCFRTWLESTGEKHGRVSESEFRHEATTNHGLELKKHRGENYYVNVHGAAWKEEEEEGNLVMFAPLTDDNY